RLDAGPRVLELHRHPDRADAAERDRVGGEEAVRRAPDRPHASAARGWRWPRGRPWRRRRHPLSSCPGAAAPNAVREDVISLDIRFGSRDVPVLLGTGTPFEQAATNAIRALAADRVFVIVDGAVARLYRDDVTRFAGLGTSPGVVFAAPEGERCKTLPVLGEF